MVKKGIVKGGGLFWVCQRQSRLYIVGSPSTYTSRTSHYVVQKEEVVIEGSLQKLLLKSMHERHI